MSHPENEPTVQISIRLFEGDKEELASFYPLKGYNWVIRHLVRRHLKGLREKLNQRNLGHEDEIQLPE